MKFAHVVIVAPNISDVVGNSTYGNEQTAQRWQRMLQAGGHHCRLATQWPDKFANQDEVMIALHARRSADSIAAWHKQHGSTRLLLALTGTDLYRDIKTHAAAQTSLAMASSLIVLQELAPLGLPEEYRAKTEVIFQSTASQPTLKKPTAHLRAVMVGHLRDEKSPETLFAAARLLQAEDRIFIDHVGAGLDAALAKTAEATQASCPHYRWLQAQPHETTRRAIARAHVLVHASKMEGGAHVLMEAACSGTPVLASRIDGNVGMLGADYAGYFDWGDAAGLARLLRECQASQNDPNGFLAQLQNQVIARASLFAPEREREKLNALVESLLP